MQINSFPAQIKVEWIAADTETHTYIDGKLCTEDEIKEMGKHHGVDFFREHTTVKCYAWLISNGQYFAWCDTFEEFITFCAVHRVQTVWWYNAKFDFSIIDYEILSNPLWIAHEHGHMQPYMYKSLHNDFGARYSLSLCVPYKLQGKHQNHERNHTTTHYDFCNIFGGGLAKILNDFNVTDFDGKPIRKLSMDYQAKEATAEAVQYMRNDVDGLYHAVRLADEFIQANFGRRIAGKKPDIMTAGGLAKKVMLQFLYGGDDKYNKFMFQSVHRIEMPQDTYYRVHGLYRGGICILNPLFANTLQRQNMWRFDVNSMYPKQMHEMPDIQGFPRIISYDDYIAGHDDKHIYIFSLKHVHGVLKKNKLPVWYDMNLRDYVSIIDFSRENNNNKTQFMFDFEFIEQMQWYDMDFEIDKVLQFEAINIAGYRDFVETYYTMKAEAKREGNKIKQSFAKLCLNSAYGKLAENPRRIACHREISEESGAVHLVIDEEEIDENAILSIVQGALVTAMSRTYLLSKMRDITHGDVLHKFVYCDTDSIHAIVPYDKCDKYELGALKDETEGKPFNCWKYIAPKTYFDGHEENGIITDIELHTKGVSVSVVEEQLKNGSQYKTAEEIDKIFATGVQFQPLTALNVKGGKALIPIAKYLCLEANVTKFNDDGEYTIYNEKEG